MSTIASGGRSCQNEGMETPRPTACGPSPSPADAWPVDEAEATAALAKVLADPVRLGLFMAIAATEDTVCVCALPDLGVSQPTVSHHLRRLREAGLIASERRGSWVHYAPTRAGRAVVPALALLRSAAVSEPAVTVSA